MNGTDTNISMGVSTIATAVPQIRFENGAATGDAVIQPYGDATGTLLYFGSNVYLNNGVQTKYNTGEESCSLWLNRDGAISFYTGGTSGIPVIRQYITNTGVFVSNYPIQVADDTRIQSSSSNYLELDASSSMVQFSNADLTTSANGNIYADIDQNNNTSDATFSVRKDAAATTLFTLNEGGDVTTTGDVQIAAGKDLKLGTAVLGSQYEQIIPASADVYAHWGNGTSGVFLSDPSAGAGLYNVLSFKTENTSAGAQAIIEIATINSATEDSGTVAVGEYRAYRDLSTPAAIVTRPLYQWKNATTAVLTLQADGSLDVTGDITITDDKLIQSSANTSTNYIDLNSGGGNTLYRGAGSTTIRSNSGVSIDIDYDNSQADREFTIRTDAAGVELMNVGENGVAAFANINSFTIASSSSSSAGIELGNSGSSGTTPFFDFHYGNSSAEDYNARLINVADGTLSLLPGTVSGSILDIDFETMSMGAIGATASFVAPSSGTTTPSILFENTSASTADATISAYQDSSGTDVWIGSNFYLSSGNATRYNTGEESSYIVANRTGNIYLGTGGTGATATTQMSINSTGLFAYTPTTGITASTTQTQGNGALTSSFNEVSTVANTNDTVTLPTAAAGVMLVIINNGANTLQIFPASGDNLGAGVNTAITLASGSNATYYAYDATNWETL